MLRGSAEKRPEGQKKQVSLGSMPGLRQLDTTKSPCAATLHVLQEPQVQWMASSRVSQEERLQATVAGQSRLMKLKADCHPPKDVQAMVARSVQEAGELLQKNHMTKEEEWRLCFLEGVIIADQRDRGLLQGANMASPGPVGMMVNKVDSSQVNQMVAAANDPGFTGPCLGDKSLITTQKVDAEVQTDPDDLGFTGCHLIASSGDLMTTQTEARLSTTQARRLRKNRVEKKWKEMRRAAAEST